MPWPFSSPVGGPWPGVVVVVDRLRDLARELGLPGVDAGVDDRDRRAVSPRLMSHAAGRFMRATHHCSSVPAGVARRGLGRRQRRVVGHDAQLVAALDLDAAHAGRPRRLPASDRQRVAGRSGARRRGRSAAPARRRGARRPRQGRDAARAVACGLERHEQAAGELRTTAPAPAGTSSSASASSSARGETDSAMQTGGGGRPAGPAAGSEAQRELRVLAHLLRRPRRVEHHRALDRATPSSGATNSSICSVICGPIGQAGVVSVNVTWTLPAVLLDAVDEPQLDEVQPELGVDDVGERLFDLFECCHGGDSSGSGPASSRDVR